MSEPMLILTNVPDAATAHALAHRLLEQQLAACVNILPAVQSLYRWDGKIEQATECSVLIKTSGRHYAGVESTIVDMHPYTLPEIIALPIVTGLPAYLAWLAAATDDH